MKLHQLTATFGRLSHETLTLHDGLNVITAPNEAGKSTWSAFLLAMFYGIDTGERSKGGSLPAKTKYKPWSGEAMAGSMTLTHEGQEITIERGSTKQAPMGVFTAYGTESGQAVPDLTGENCGQSLLGVERSVFERSAFLRQAGLAVTRDSALERRLQSLVTTGEESVSYTQVEKALRDLRNRRQSNKSTGLIPQCEQQLAAVNSKLDQLRACNQENAALLTRQQALLHEQETLSGQLAAVRAQEAAQKFQQLQQAKAEAQAAQKAAQELAAACGALPVEADLRELLAEAMQLASATPETVPDTPPEPPVPPAPFQGMDKDAAQRQVEDDLARYDALSAAPTNQKSKAWFALPAALAVLAVVLFAVSGLIGLVPLACAAVLAVWLVLQQRQAAQQAQSRAAAMAEILRRYGASDRADLPRMASSYREDCIIYDQQLAHFRERQAAAQAAAAAYDTRVRALLTRTARFAPVTTLGECRAAIEQALRQRASSNSAAQQAEALEARYRAVLAAVGELPAVAEVEVVSAQGLPSAANLTAQLARVQSELDSVRSQLDLARGKVSALGDPASLDAEREQLTARLNALRAQYDALELALDALNQANAALQTRFSPQLNREAAQIMARLTNGRYESVLLDDSLSISAKTTDDVLSHPLAALSVGTGDQLCLAVRLAIARLTLPADAPLILDDALVMFDDERLGTAMALLQEEAAHRQILLFTCQSREQAWLDSHS
jgi:uncharacterized protein YhaN